MGERSQGEECLVKVDLRSDTEDCVNEGARAVFAPRGVFREKTEQIMRLAPGYMIQPADQRLRGNVHGIVAQHLGLRMSPEPR
jgi:hypothetical protein